MLPEAFPASKTFGVWVSARCTAQFLEWQSTPTPSTHEHWPLNSALPSAQPNLGREAKRKAFGYTKARDLRPHSLPGVLVGKGSFRMSVVVRQTSETKVRVEVSRGSGEANISTGHPFFDHMLRTFARYSGLDCASRRAAISRTT